MTTSNPGTVPHNAPSPAERSDRLRVRDELEQRSVGVAEVDALAVAAGAAARDRADLDLDAHGRQVLDRAVEGAVPDEADIAVPRTHGIARHRRRVDAWAVHVQLLVAEAVRVAGHALP